MSDSAQSITADNAPTPLAVDDAASMSKARRGLLAVSAMLATILQTLDTTIANVALPSIQGSMSATQDQMAWVLTSYIIAAAIMTPPTGWLAARFGRKRLFMIAVGGFVGASMLCGAATSIEQMILFRLLQGMSGAALIPLSQALMLDVYPPDKGGRGQAMALWGMGVMIGPIIGPTLGGWLTEYFSWRYVFYINLPFGILALIGLSLFMPDKGREHERSFDWRGFFMLSVALGALQLMMDRGEGEGWFSSPEIVIEAILGGLGLYLFVIHMLSSRNTFITPRIFKDRNFTVGLITLFVISINMLATLALLPPFLQQLGGYTVLDTGFIMAPRGFGTMMGMMLVGRLIGMVDERLLITAGLLLGICSLYIMTGFTPEVARGTIAVSGFVQGVGFGLVFVPLSAIAFATLDMSLRVEGSSLFSLIRNVGSSIGISIIFRELATGTQNAHAILTENLTAYSQPLRNLGDSIGAEAGDPAMMSILNGMVTREAASLAYIHDFWLMIAITAAALPFILLLRRNEGPAAMPG